MSLKATRSVYLKLEHKSITILSRGNPKTRQEPDSFFEEPAYQEGHGFEEFKCALISLNNYH